MSMAKTHWLLCAADDFSTARDTVQKFFSNTMLLNYDAVKIVEQGSWSAHTDEFWFTLDEGIAANQQVLAGLLDDLKGEGCREIADLMDLPMGYPSKVLHIIAHLLDGFIGIDSVFYNLSEDSNWLSDGLRDAIHQDPTRYWLIRVEASFTTATSPSFIPHLQRE
jgi:hypothetical protein